ncbi:hypothetical protein [Clostridium sp. AM58-1XD]|uniref:hypothetical protein n=1 Tax=Clostridium sp. AM58-1XD TaxID=2292307 RepID=UPI000E4C6777|nr:hypothetical protein [Clostridium sp. AM58-1XD]RGY95869.1 hypothetical protein DXA13_18405 [Clostridium sp. AM58-1XD]
MKKSWALIIMVMILGTGIAAGCSRDDWEITTEEAESGNSETAEGTQGTREKFLGIITNIDGSTITVSVEEEISEERRKETLNKKGQDQGEKQEPLSDMPEGVTDLRVQEEVVVFDLSPEIRICKAEEGKQVEIEAQELKEGDFVKLERENGMVTFMLVMNGMPGMNKTEIRGEDAVLDGAYTLEGETADSSGEKFASEMPDQNAVLVKAKGSLQLTNADVSKTGSTSSQDDSSFFGVNAAVAAIGGGRIQLQDTTVESDGEGTNAVFASGNGTEITGHNLKISTNGVASRGLTAADRGIITAVNTDIATEDSQSAPAAAIKKGILSLKEGILSSAGEESPCIYSEGTVNAENVTGTADSSRILVIEGSSSAVLKQCALTGAGSTGILICRKAVSDDESGTAMLHIMDSILTTSSGGPMFYIVKTDAEIIISNSALNFDSGILAQVSGRNVMNRKQVEKRGGTLTLTANSQELKGDIICDEISGITLKLTVNSVLEGAVNGEGQSKAVEVNLDPTSSWIVTGDSHIAVLRNEQADNSNIQSNGYTIFYDSSREENSWLGGETIELQDGGKIAPEQ